MSERPAIYYWVPAIVWVCLIAMASTDAFSSNHTDAWLHPLFHRIFPDMAAGTWNWVHAVLRKLGHWTGYLILAAAFHRGFRKGNARIWRHHWAFWTLVLVLMVALGDEWHQSFTAERTGSLRDSLLDFFGGACAIGFEYLLFRRRLARHEAKPERPAVS